jgi:hypothetical protein
MNKTTITLIMLLLITACAKDNTIEVCTKVTPLIPNQPATPEAMKLAQEFQVSFPNATPAITKDTFSQPLRICKNQANCDMWESCYTYCDFRSERTTERVICPIDSKSVYLTVTGKQGLCRDVMCKNQCNETINIPHAGCC